MDTTLSDPLVGRLLEGRYAVEAFIAHGGMASVYLATDTRLERRVAVKVLHAHLSDDRETVARFEREARAAARLSHPDVVAVYDQGTDNGRPFLVMEFVPGANLRQVVRDRGRLTPGEAVAVMDHVLAALAAAHGAGLVHRDVKPENVLVTADGRVKVADFGLARAISGTTVTTTGSVLMGTAAYLAPEQFELGTADERSDVYSAGVVFFELLTGTTPFQADSAYALLSKHANEDIPAPSTRAAGIPPQLDALVTWATSRDPQERPAAAGELHESLNDVRDRLGLHSAVPTPPIALTTKFTSGNTTVVAPTSEPETTMAMAPPSRPGRPVGGAAASAPRKKRRSRRPLIITLILALVVAGAAVAGWWFAAGRYTDAPNVLGMSRTEATSKLTNAGLKVAFLPSIYSLKTGKDLVASETGTGHVTHGSTVSLRLSLGARPHILSSYSGQSLSSTKSSLAAIHIGVKKVDQVFSDSVNKGRVVDTIPTAGQQVLEGKKIEIEVSKGVQHVTVPHVTGLSQQDASDLLQGKGFTLNTPVDRFSSTVTSGNVITSHPTEGRSLAKGAPITLVVSKGPKTYPVPDVTQESLATAIKTLKQAGFVSNPKQLFPDGPGIVDRETPTGNQPRGTTIELDYI